MSFTKIIAKWPSTADLAADLGESANTVKKWGQRNSIPSEYWLPLVRAAARRELTGVSLEACARAAENRQRKAAPRAERRVS